MRNTFRLLIGINALASVATMMVSTHAGAQEVGYTNQGATAGMPAMPKVVSPPGVVTATPLSAYPSQSTAPSGVPANAESDVRQRNTLRSITEKKAELELLKVQSDIDKFKKPLEDAAKKEEASAQQAAALQAAFEQSKKEQAAAPRRNSAAAASAAVEQSPPVLLLATFGSPELPALGYAELKVGDLLVHAKVGDRLPTGQFLKAVNFDSVEISKSKTAKSGKVIYITPADTASVYSARAKSGVSAEPAPTSNMIGSVGARPGMQSIPNGLPPMLGGQ